MVLKELVKALTDILQVEKSIHIANALRNNSNINKLFLMILLSFGLCLLLSYHMVPKATEALTQFKINCNALPAVVQARSGTWSEKKIVSIRNKDGRMVKWSMQTKGSVVSCFGAKNRTAWSKEASLAHKILAP